MKQLNRELCTFLDTSPTCYHAVKNIADSLEKEGYCPLRESEAWSLVEGESILSSAQTRRSSPSGSRKRISRAS